MKELNMSSKYKVIKLFLQSLSFDEIAVQTGVGKGSVFNIVEEFKSGDLSTLAFSTGLNIPS